MRPRVTAEGRGYRAITADSPKGIEIEKATEKRVANTIREQIGPKSFYMMGAKNLTITGRGLTWKIGRNAKSVSHVSVTLRGDDTYTVKTIRCRAGKIKTLSEHEGIYVDMLHEIIESETGMCLTFPTVRFA